MQAGRRPAIPQIAGPLASIAIRLLGLRSLYVLWYVVFFSTVGMGEVLSLLVCLFAFEFRKLPIT